ncbi:MAG: hypothetical protein IT210_03980 [Armatimonadetes bacterium]|nr:hypothetical protein [Armatimonadota bacterium]
MTLETTLSKFIDELVEEGEEPRIREFLERHSDTQERLEAAQQLKTALLAQAALQGIEVPAQWEAEARARAIDEAIRRFGVSQPRKHGSSIINRLGHLFKRKH